MKIHVLLVALVATVALASPAEVMAKTKKKLVHRAPAGAMYSKGSSNSSYDVYVSGELVGRDPDPSIRAYMMRSPHPWDGPE